jgi:DNA-binding HxlR family transcriptional regulator
VITILEKVNKLEEFPSEIKSALSALDQENRQKIILHLIQKPQLSFTALKDLTELKSSTLSFHLKKLMHASLIDNFYQKSENPQRKYSYYKLTEFGKDLCESLFKH